MFQQLATQINPNKTLSLLVNLQFSYGFPVIFLWFSLKTPEMIRAAPQRVLFVKLLSRTAQEAVVVATHGRPWYGTSYKRDTHDIQVPDE